MGEFEKLLEDLGEVRELRRGDVVKGRVVKLDERNAYVDIGFKVEGIVPREELPETIKEGDEIKAVFVRFTKAGSPILSYQRYVKDRLISFLKNAFEKGKFVEGKVEEKTEEGFVVNISGLKAFLPKEDARKGLKVGSRVVAKIKQLVQEGKDLKVVLSEREYLEVRKEAKKERLLKRLKEGDVIWGRVIKIDPEKGITLLVQGVLRAFLPKEELSWGRDKNPYNYAEVGERLKVKVKRIPKDGQFIFVSLRELKENPWLKIKDTLKKGDKVEGRVVEVNEKGLVVELSEGVEGFVPKSEISYDGTVPNKGDRISAIVLDLDVGKRSLILSIKRALPKPWEEFLKEHPVGSKVVGRVEKIEGASAIVDLGKVRGIIHRSDLSWTRPGRIEEVLKVGEEREFAVLGSEGRYIKLGIKQLTQNPWDIVAQRYKVGDRVKLRVRSLHTFGAFLEFPEGIDGLLPISEMSKDTKLEEGQEVEVRIIELVPGNRITLSMKEEQPVEEIITQSSESGFTLGDILRKKLKL
ncbi:RNA binding S1 domain protein [Thermocrinis albus DSM 14484]|uniref:RNA binding S1 domain protein n=1 Tax=Thermocrinis albus (strain DSM 14484 / JCM 11386 / HI 11/12) TaxID=638303 RepID=D3SQ94_THEAH|nr:S1 RNA-binding domain-containing protein [Thermocrinis albus]ADC89331.1 RNA binding S1 domain protein [Thermocrinis albus DSM 14484]